MNPEQVACLIPRPVLVPRGAAWAAALAGLALQGLHQLAAQPSSAVLAAAAALARSVWPKRGAAAVRTKPPSTPEQRVLEAASVRELAYSYLKKDPGFAGDLLAAADRHERENEASI